MWKRRDYKCWREEGNVCGTAARSKLTIILFARAISVTVYGLKSIKCHRGCLGNNCDKRGEKCVFCFAVPDFLFGISNKLNEQGFYMPQPPNPRLRQRFG